MKNTHPSFTFRFIGSVLTRALLLFLAFDLLFALVNPLPALGRISIYNGIIPGRARLPFGEQPGLAYNLSLYSLEAMFASHEVSRAKASGEYRVLVVGDSSVWGTLLTPEQTLTGHINAGSYRSADGRTIRAYNLGYPTITLTKDLLLLSRLCQYQPDMIIWLVTLEAFPRTKQLTSPILQNNAAEVQQLIRDNHLQLDEQNPALLDPSFWQRSLIGQRRALADIFRLQLYGVMWAATGIDQYYPETYELRASDLQPDDTFQELEPPNLLADDLSLDVLTAGMNLFPEAPVLLVNEPMFISSGANSEIRYNFYYPRWAYEDYRQILSDLAVENNWHYLDLWNIVPAAEFTNSAIHMTPVGTAQLADRVAQALIELTGTNP